MGENAPKQKCWFKRHLVYILGSFAILAVLIGTIGFCRYYSSCYYSNHKSSFVVEFFIALYNVLRLFTMNIDSEFNNPACVGKDVFVLLLFARFLAFVPIAGTVFAIFKALLPKVLSRIVFDRWSIRKNRLLLIGNNSENIRLFHSAANPKEVLLLSEIGKDTAPLRAQGVRYYTSESAYVNEEDGALEEVLSKQLDAVLRDPKKTLRVIINTHDDALNLRLCRAAADCIQDAIGEDVRSVNKREKEIKQQFSGKDERKNQLRIDKKLVELKREVVEKLERVSVFAFGEREHEQVYRILEDRAVGALHTTSRYHLASFEFLTQHPMTEFLSVGNEPDGCVDKDAEFNMLLIGFGNTNREIFLDSFSTNTFVTRDDNEIPRLKSVNYHIFDSHENADHDRLLNHTIYRFLRDFQKALDKGTLNEADYLDDRASFPMPSDPQFHPIDYDDKNFYSEVRDVCMKNPKSINYLLIAVGDDFSNIDLARRLAEKKNEWGVPNLYIFAKVRDKRNECAAFLEDGEQEEPYLTYGNEDFTIERVLHNEIEAMAHHRKRVTQNVESTEKDLPNRMTDDTIQALFSWHIMDYDQRRSSLYNLLGLRMKLQLLGLDYKPEAEVDKTSTMKSEKAYCDFYARGCTMEKNPKPEAYRGARYSYEKGTSITDFKKNLPRMNLAVQEHYRWNAYMIGCGFIPAKRAQIEAGKPKSYVGTRYHANLTSFEALFKFSKLSQKDDVIPYDFKLLDEAYFFLNTPDTVTGREYQIVWRKGGGTT